MRSFLIVVLLIAVGAVGVSVYDATVSPAATVPGAKTASPALSEARMFMLLPDGKVEITDAWSRRVFHWDGQRWIEGESSPAPLHPARSR
jgi:hypothetical protein